MNRHGFSAGWDLTGKISLILLLVVTPVAFLAGCGSEAKIEDTPPAPPPIVETPSAEKPSATEIPEPPEPAKPPEQTATVPSSPATPPEPDPDVNPSPGQISFSATPDIEALKDSHWISPGKVNIDNLYPGATAEYPITVHNGGDTETEFSIRVRTPDQVSEGYEPLPEEFFNWISIEQPVLELKAKQTGDVLITVTMPDDVKYSGKQAEFWVVVMDQGQSGMVKTELAARWLISTR